MARREYWTGSIGPFVYDDDNSYPDGQPHRAFRADNATISALGGQAVFGADSLQGSYANPDVEGVVEVVSNSGDHTTGGVFLTLFQGDVSGGDYHSFSFAMDPDNNVAEHVLDARNAASILDYKFIRDGVEEIIIDDTGVYIPNFASSVTAAFIANDVTTDQGTEDSPKLPWTAKYDSDTSTGVTSTDVTWEAYHRMLPATTESNPRSALEYEYTDENDNTRSMIAIEHSVDNTTFRWGGNSRIGVTGVTAPFMVVQSDSNYYGEDVAGFLAYNGPIGTDVFHSITVGVTYQPSNNREEVIFQTENHDESQFGTQPFLPIRFYVGDYRLSIDDNDDRVFIDTGNLEVNTGGDFTVHGGESHLENTTGALPLRVLRTNMTAGELSPGIRFEATHDGTGTSSTFGMSLDFRAENAGGSLAQLGVLSYEWADPSSGAEDTTITFWGAGSGTVNAWYHMNEGSLYPENNDTQDLGGSTKSWSTVHTEQVQSEVAELTLTSTNEVQIQANASAPADGDVNNSRVVFWLDETNDQIEVKAKESGGTVLTETIGSGGGGASQLDDLSDVSITSPTADEALQYDGSTWVNSTVDHSELSGVGASDHHARYTDSEAVSAVTESRLTSTADNIPLFLNREGMPEGALKPLLRLEAEHDGTGTIDTFGGSLDFRLENSAGTLHAAGGISIEWLDATGGSEDFEFGIFGQSGGAQGYHYRANSGAFYPENDGTQDLGGSTNSWSTTHTEQVQSENGDLTLSSSTTDIDVASHVLKNVTDPSNAQDAATKNYVDNNAGATQLTDLSDVGTAGTTDGFVLAADGTDYGGESITSITESHVNLADLADVDTTVSNSQLTNDTVTVAGNAVALGGSTAVAHSDLSSIGSSDHHTRYSDAEAVSAVESQNPLTLSGVLELQHSGANVKMEETATGRFDIYEADNDVLRLYSMVSGNFDVGISCDPTGNQVTLGGAGAGNFISVGGGGTVSVESNNITNLADPNNAQDAATKNYVDNNTGGGGATELNDLSDVSTSAESDGDVLRFNSGTADYENTALDHADLTGVGSSDHHSRYSDNEAVSAVENENSLTLDADPLNPTSDQSQNIGNSGSVWSELWIDKLRNDANSLQLFGNMTRAKAIASSVVGGSATLELQTEDSTDSIASGIVIRGGGNQDVEFWYGSSTQTFNMNQAGGSPGSTGDLYISGTVTESHSFSDPALKSNMRPLGYGLDEILSLSTIFYDFREGNITNRPGFDATEVEQVMPELVGEEYYLGEYDPDDDGLPTENNQKRKTLRHDDLIPVLVSAIQTQQDKIDELETRVANLS